MKSEYINAPELVPPYDKLLSELFNQQSGRRAVVAKGVAWFYGILDASGDVYREITVYGMSDSIRLCEALSAAGFRKSSRSGRIKYYDYVYRFAPDGEHEVMF